MSINVDLKILDNRLHHMMPAYATTGSAGLDLRACTKHTQTIQPGETKMAIFHLQATTVGEFGGSIRIYIGDLSKYFPYIGIVIQE